MAETKSGSVKWNNIKAEELIFKASSGSLKLNGISGKAQLQANSGSISLTDFNGSGSAKASSGSVKIEAGTIDGDFDAQATSGTVRVEAEEVKGNITGGASSGSVNLEIGALTGDAAAKASSGTVRVKVSEMAGNLEAEASSGSVKVELPLEMKFHFDAQTTSGGIHTSFDNALSFNKKGNEAKGDIGENPEYQVRVSASSGSVTVNQR